MSINRTRWLDKLRPTGASSGGWTEGPMAPVETTDAATIDQRFKHRTGWRHHHSNSKLCVALRMGQANLLSITNVIFAQEPCNNVQKKKLRHPCAAAMRQCPAEDKASGSSRSSHLRTSIRGFHRFAPREHHVRSFWRETWR